MTLTELLATLPEDLRDSVGNYIASSLEAEKQIGIAATKKKNGELLSAQEKLSTLGYDKEKFETFDSFKDSISQTQKAATDSSMTIAQLNDRITDLDTKYTLSENKRMEAEDKVTDGVLRTKLDKQIGKKLYGGDFLVDNIILNKRLIVDGDNITTTDGKTFETFVNETLESNKGNIKSEQTPGSDTLTTNKQKQTVLSEEDAFIDRMKKNINN